MKKLLSLLILVLSASLVKATIIEKTYYFSKPKIVNRGEYQKISFSNTLLTNRAGEPALPYYAVSLLLPPGERALKVEISGEDEIVIPGKFQLQPYQPSRTLNDTTTAPFVKNEAVYSSQTTIPQNPAGRLKTAFMNGYGFALTTFTPLQYSPAAGKVSYFQKVTVRITTTAAKNANFESRNLKSSVPVIRKVLTLAQNPKAIKKYSTKQTRSATDYRLLIITGTNYLNSFDSLQNIYLERGIRSNIYSVSYINNNISGQDLQEKIRNFIIQEYQNHNVEFVLLGGDVEIVPYRGFYCYVQSGSGYESNDIPADLYYSALDGTWNDDGDDRWGEPDEDDLLPDVSVARMSFSNSTELAALIHKSIWYQNKPVLGEFTNPLLAGEYLYADPITWGSDYLNLLIGTHSDNGYTTTGIPPTYTIDSMYEKHQSWSGTDLINRINQGTEFVHHVGHANSTYVAHLYNDDITDANFYAVNGVTHNYSLFFSHGCICGAFDYDDCILERMVNINNFATAVFGNSRYGWFNEGQTEGPAAHLHREFVDALFSDSLNRVGRALMESKIATSPWVEAPGQWEEGALRWNFYDLNALGDPAMAIWTNEPITINVTYNPTIPLDADSLLVHVENDSTAVGNLTCSVLKDGSLIGYAFTDSLGNATVIFDTLVTTPGDGSLIVSGYNCLPDTNSLYFVPTATPYVVYAENTIHDSLGNNNGTADYGETISLDVAITNVGSLDAHNVTSELSSVNGNVVILDDTAEYGLVAVADTVWNQNAFTATIANNVPDGEEIIFQLQNNADEGSWASNFSILVNAPQLTAGNIIIDDSQYGDGNGMLDPGETAMLLIPSSNFGHAGCDSAVGTLTLNNPWITLGNSEVQLGALLADSTKMAAFQITVNPNTPVGTTVAMHYQLTAGAYTTEKDYTVPVGLLIEDFETGDFSKFEWNSSGAAPWVITGESPYQGLWCAKSGTVGDSQHSDLSVDLLTAEDDSISFVRKVSSEEGYDFLYFYIDDMLVDKWSGELDWAKEKYPINEGEHTLLWSYEKDINQSEGSDCAWLDSIVFPATTIAVNVEENKSEKNVTIFPNPCHGKFTLHLNNSNNQQASVTIYNALGNKVLEKSVPSVSNSCSVDLTGNSRGLYFVEVHLGNSLLIKKVVIL